MISIFGSALWLLYVTQRLTSWLERVLPSTPVAPLKTANRSPVLSGSWRPLSSSSNGPGSRYLVRHAASPNTYAIYVYDLRTTFTWRCDFFSQHERNTYLNDLRRGSTQTWPQVLIYNPKSKYTTCEH